MRARSEGEMGLYVSRICLSPGRAANSLQLTRAANLLLLVIPLAGCGETIANAPMSPSCELAKLSYHCPREYSEKSQRSESSARSETRQSSWTGESSQRSGSETDEPRW